MTEPRTEAGPRCTCTPPDGVTRNHANGCALFDVRAAYRQGLAEAATGPRDPRNPMCNCGCWDKDFEAAAGPRDEGLRAAAQRLSDHLFEIYDLHIDREYPWEADWKALRAALAKASE